MVQIRVYSCRGCGTLYHGVAKCPGCQIDCEKALEYYIKVELVEDINEKDARHEYECRGD